MDPLTMSLLVGIPAAVKTGTGIVQFLEGRKALRNTKRPMREIPREVIANLTQAEVQALEGMPEEQRNLYLQDMQRSQQQAVRGLADRRAGIAGIPQLYQGELDSLNRLAMQDSQMRLQNQDRLTAQRAEMGRQMDTQFQLNEFEPFLNKMRMAEGLIGSGMQNVMGGLTDASRMAVDYDIMDRTAGGQGLSFKKQQAPVGNGFDSAMNQQVNNQLIRQDQFGNISNGMMLPPYSTNPYTGITG